MKMSPVMHAPPQGVDGAVASGFERVADVFAQQVLDGEEIGASFCVARRGRIIAHLWGGVTDTTTQEPWQRDTRIVLFSVTKGFTAMAFAMLADQGRVDYSARVADYWPGFARAGKGAITVATLLGHRGGLCCVDTPLTLSDCCDPARRAKVAEALEAQRPVWEPGTSQGYHAITYGLFAGELFERIAGESVGSFLRRELLEPMGSDVWIGAPEHLDGRVATLYAPDTRKRVVRMLIEAFGRDKTNEGRIARDVLRRGSLARRAFANPSAGPGGVTSYNSVEVRRACLPWGSATGSAEGIARAYAPFANAGAHEGRAFVSPRTLEPIYDRQGWSTSDAVLFKPLGWSHGFLKEEPHLFCPHVESFGHPGMGGALGWADPVNGISIGYAINRMDWHVRSPRALALCRALYECVRAGA